MQRMREHRINLNRLVRHEGMNPNRQLLPVMLSMWMDADAGEKEVLLELLLNTFGSPKRVRWTDDGDPKVADPQGKAEREADKTMKDVFASILQRSESSEGS